MAQQSESLLNENTTRTLIAIGQRIRDLRKGRGMTLQALADASGVSSSMLSLVERGLASPSIGSLIVVGEALGRSMSDLLDTGDGCQDDLVVHAKQAEVVVTDSQVVRRIMKEDRSNGVSVQVNEYAPGTSSAETPLSHEGFEYGYVLDGQLTVEVDGVQHAMSAGDLISYSSRRLHRVWNPGDRPARMLWFFTDRK